MTLSQAPTKQKEKLLFQSGECSVLPLGLLSFPKLENLIPLLSFGFAVPCSAPVQYLLRSPTTSS